MRAHFDKNKIENYFPCVVSLHTDIIHMLILVRTITFPLPRICMFWM